MPPSGYETRPDYRVDLLRRRNRVRVVANGMTIVDSTRAIVVDEQGHGLVYYFPRADIVPGYLVPVEEKTSHCPYKGDAAYLALAEVPGDEIAWTYPKPYPEVALITDYVAFYQDRVDVIVGGEVA